MGKRGAGQDPSDTAVGARIRIRRRQLGVSQSDLADRIGVSFQQVQKYEQGTNRISASTLLAIAAALECPGAALLGDEQVSAADAELMALLAEDGAVELLQAFNRIPDRETRQAVLSVAEGLAGGAATRARKRS